jgi:hypothetical protein
LTEASSGRFELQKEDMRQTPCLDDECTVKKKGLRWISQAGGLKKKGGWRQMDEDSFEDKPWMAAFTEHE